MDLHRIQAEPRGEIVSLAERRPGFGKRAPASQAARAPADALAAAQACA
jgi:hypothetical protein